MSRILLLAICLWLFLALGCQSRNGSAAGREQWNRERFGSTPPSVTDGFLRDYPDTTVTKVSAYRLGWGRTVYGVDYIRHNKMKFATYADTGERISPPIPPVTAY